MGSHSVTCHPTQVNAPRLTPTMQAGTRLTYPEGMEGWVDQVGLIAPRPGVEPATFRSRVRRRTAAPPRQPNTAARLVLGLDCHSSITAALCKLPQLPVHYRILYKVASLMHDVFHHRCAAALKASAFTDKFSMTTVPVKQSTDTYRTRHFFHNGGRNHRYYGAIRPRPTQKGCLGWVTEVIFIDCRHPRHWAIRRRQRHSVGKKRYGGLPSPAD